MEHRVVEISWGTLWRVFIFLIIAAIILFARNIILALFMALVVSSGLDAVIDFLERKGMPRSLGVILIFLISAVAMALLVSFVIPFLVADVESLFANNGAAFQVLLDRIGPTGTGASLSTALSNFGNEIFAGGSSSFAFLSNLLGGVGLAATIFVTSFYLALSRDGVERFIRTVFPDSSGIKALRIYTRARRKIGFWFQSQILLSFIMGLLVWITLLILGVKHAFVLGVLTGVFELVPFAGPILAGSVSALVGLTTSLSLAVSILIAFLIIQQIESHFLVPLLMRKTVDLHPVVVIISLLIGIEAGGILGALISVPMAGVIQEILAERKQEAI